MSLPSRDECEAWSPEQVAHFLNKNHLQDCATTISRLRIDGFRFLNLSDCDLHRLSPVQLPQLQKLVQDIKKNEGGLLDKLKRFKNKSSPKVPARDYQGDDLDGDEQWSDAEFESDTYEDPQEDQDDSYEPPPSHRVFHPTPSTAFPRGEYLDSCRNRPNHPPKKPLRPPKTSKPLPPKPPPIPADDDDEDYINPDSDSNDDYIDPTEKPPANPPIQSRTKVLKPIPLPPKPVPARPSSPDVYEVPDNESSPPQTRLSTINRTPSHALPPRTSPRIAKRKPVPVHEPKKEEEDEDNEYEMCNSDDGQSIKTAENSPQQTPKPKPRERQPKPALKPRPDFKHKESEGPPVPTRNGSQKPTLFPPTDFSLPRIHLPPLFTSHRPNDKRRGSNTDGLPDSEKDEDLSQKPWYASACDRKTAEDALLRSNKDGSFLVRKSSGQDTQQPYTLVVFYNGRVYNIPVRYIQTAQQYALGSEKKGEERFNSVSHIIENHQWNPLVLIDSQSNTKDATKLSFPVRP